MRRQKKILSALGLIALMIIASAATYKFSSGSAAQEPGQESQPPQAMPVQALMIKSMPVQIWNNFSGHVVAVDQAEIRPQVSGRITEIRFEDGQHVKKGDVLIVIDPSPYLASLNQAKAALAAARTQASLAEKEYQRSIELIKTQAISQKLLDERTNGRQVAAAAVQQAKAQVESAQINLDYAYVKAPIDGKVSRAEITEGNVVEAGPNAPLLTTVVADESVYVDFEVDDQTYLSTVRLKKPEADNKIPVRLSLLDGEMEFAGYIQSFDNRINPASGTIRARALFENRNQVLLPGMAVSVLMGSAGRENHILIPERAIGTDQDRKFAYIVNEEGKTSYREIGIGQSVNGERIVLSGLKEGEVVITEGLSRIRPDMPVSPQFQSRTPEPSETPIPNTAVKE